MDKNISNEHILSPTVAIPAIFYRAFMELVKQQSPIVLDLNVLLDKEPSNFQIDIDRVLETITFSKSDLTREALQAQLESIGEEKH